MYVYDTSTLRDSQGYLDMPGDSAKYKPAKSRRSHVVLTGRTSRRLMLHRWLGQPRRGWHKRRVFEVCEVTNLGKGALQYLSWNGKYNYRERTLRRWVKPIGQHVCIPQLSRLLIGYPAGGSGMCHGDSGGPLFCRGKYGNYYIHGITSWSIGCARKNKPGVYTRVYHYNEWIKKVIESDLPKTSEDISIGVTKTWSVCKTCYNWHACNSVFVLRMNVRFHLNCGECTNH